MKRNTKHCIKTQINKINVKMYTGHIAHIRQHTNDICNSLFGSTFASVDLTSKGGKFNVV